jgi:hypothetical protein
MGDIVITGATATMTDRQWLMRPPPGLALARCCECAYTWPTQHDGKGTYCPMCDSRELRWSTRAAAVAHIDRTFGPPQTKTGNRAGRTARAESPELRELYHLTECILGMDAHARWNRWAGGNYKQFGRSVRMPERLAAMLAGARADVARLHGDASADGMPLARQLRCYLGCTLGMSIKDFSRRAGLHYKAVIDHVAAGHVGKVSEYLRIARSWQREDNQSGRGER